MRYNYKISEVAFLYHKLNQYANQFKAIKRKGLLRKWKRRERYLEEISENVERALKIFHKVELEKKLAELSRVKKRRLFNHFGEQAKAAVIFDKNNLEELRAKRNELMEQFDKVCAEEVMNIKNLVAAFQEDSVERLCWQKTVTLVC